MPEATATKERKKDLVQTLNGTDLKLVISDEVRHTYNNSLSLMQPGKNTMVGYDEQRRGLAASFFNPDPISIILGREGVGKTAVVEQFIYDNLQKPKPVLIVQLNLEKLGELGQDFVASRMRSILSDMKRIQLATVKANETDQFKMALFIDEIHKLAFYGVTTRDQGSMAMNALKEETSRGVFPLIGATTDREFARDIKPDKPFARRFSVIKMNEPSPDTVVQIILRKLDVLRDSASFFPNISLKDANDLVKYSNAYIYDQANPAKALTVLNKCIGLCRFLHATNPQDGFNIDHDILRAVFRIYGFDIDAAGDGIQVVIPPDIQIKYNHALFSLPMGDNTLVGYKSQLDQLDASLWNIKQPSALLLGPAGVGKTATVEQWIYNRSKTKKKVAVVALAIEKLGEMDENIVIARMRDLLDDLKKIYQTTQEANPHVDFQMALFIDEIHKLNNYGATTKKEGSSAAMNAIKERLARGAFPVIGATTDYEYRQNIVADEALDRRFGKIAMEQPTLKAMREIITRQLANDNKQIGFKILLSDRMLTELINYSDSFIRNQANPAKTLSILDKCTGYCRRIAVEQGLAEVPITHEILKQVFKSEGYSIDTATTPEVVEGVVGKGIIGQPLAIHQLNEVIRSSLYTKRDFDKPLMTAFFIGSTGVGKTETAKLLAKAFYGRRDAMVMINCGDYATKASAIDAQHYIGDRMQINKQQVILLDEIEKADIAVMDTFMRMIDDGIVLDSHNIERSINSTVVIATTNLGAKEMSRMTRLLKLNLQQDPNRLDPRLVDEWSQQEQTIRHALQNGDEGLNNGIKPEFLDRFSLFVPYMPLGKKTLAMIAHRHLEGFVQDMSDAGKYTINIQLPKPWSHERWSQIMETPNTEYGNDEPISVMIAEDIMSVDAKTNGARGLNHYIDQNVKPAVIDKLDERVKAREPIDGVFRLLPKNASFQTNNRERAQVKCEYIPRRSVSTE